MHECTTIVHRDRALPKKIMGPTMRLQWLSDIYLQQSLVAFIWLVMSLLPPLFPIFVCRHKRNRRETNKLHFWIKRKLIY